MPPTAALRPHHHPVVRQLAIALLLAGAAGAQAQQLTRGALSAPTAMVSVCGGLSNGSYSGIPGDAIGFIAGRVDCASGQVNTMGDSVSRGASHTEALITAANAQATATLGQVQLSSAFRANNQVGFAGGFATAGWVDTLTIQPLDLAQVGQSARLQFQVRTTGSLVGVPSGHSGAGLRLTPFVNDQFLPDDGSNPTNQGLRTRACASAARARVASRTTRRWTEPTTSAQSSPWARRSRWVSSRWPARAWPAPGPTGGAKQATSSAAWPGTASPACR